MPLTTDPTNPDTDGDGLFDVVEIAGMRMQNGYVGGENGAPLTTDPTNPDTDGDGLLDGEVRLYNNRAKNNTYKKRAFWLAFSISGQISTFRDKGIDFSFVNTL